MVLIIKYRHICNVVWNRNQIYMSPLNDLLCLVFIFQYICHYFMLINLTPLKYAIPIAIIQS